jgi:hypothetical protein
VEGVPFDSDVSFASLMSKSDISSFKTGKNSEFQFEIQVVNICWHMCVFLLCRGSPRVWIFRGNPLLHSCNSNIME